MNNEHHHGNFGNGFIFGVILGALIVFLFGTTKGKEILQKLSENGLEKVSGFADELLEDEDADEEFIPDSPEPIKSNSTNSSKTGKRFFKKK